MTSPGGQPGGEYVDAIRQDLECPNCRYNLRGLIGAVVTCPECGNNCDVAHLVANRWRKAWFRAPGFNRLVLPIGWLASVIGSSHLDAAFVHKHPRLATPTQLMPSPSAQVR